MQRFGFRICRDDVEIERLDLDLSSVSEARLMALTCLEDALAMQGFAGDLRVDVTDKNGRALFMVSLSTPNSGAPR
jgi:hypothetical protein